MKKKEIKKKIKEFIERTEKYRVVVDRISPYIRVVLGLLILIIVFVLAVNSINNSTAIGEVSAYEGEVLGEYIKKDITGSYEIVSPNNVVFELKAPDKQEIEEAKTKYKEKVKRIEEEKRRREEEERRRRMQQIEALRAYLVKMGSPMAPYSENILNTCEPHGIHYCKYFLSIAGVESGFGRIPIGCCNAWGIVGVYYPSWETSIPKASNWLLNTYYYKYSTFEQLAFSGYHGGDDEAKKAWISNLYYFYNQIPL